MAKLEKYSRLKFKLSLRYCQTRYSLQRCMNPLQNLRFEHSSKGFCKGSRLKFISFRQHSSIKVRQYHIVLVYKMFPHSKKLVYQ